MKLTVSRIGATSLSGEPRTIDGPDYSGTLVFKKPGVLERTYFPYTTGWRHVFRIRFPATTNGAPAIAPDAGVAALRFSGPLGNLELDWVLR